MIWPPSLPQPIKDRAFVASNGEIGVYLSDAEMFLNSCVLDNLEVLGWETWIVDHMLDNKGRLQPFNGHWSGTVPRKDGQLTIIGGNGSAEEVRAQLKTFNPSLEISHPWIRHIRINFSIRN